MIIGINAANVNLIKSNYFLLGTFHVLNTVKFIKVKWPLSSTGFKSNRRHRYLHK